MVKTEVIKNTFRAELGSQLCGQILRDRFQPEHAASFVELYLCALPHPALCILAVSAELRGEEKLELEKEPSKAASEMTSLKGLR